MKIEEVVNIYRNCGFKINEIDGFYFLNRGWISYSFPQLINMPLAGSVINSLKWKHILLVIKTESRIKNTYEFLLETNDYSISRFAPKKRNDIRKSLKDCVFKRPSLEDLLQSGLKMNRQTLRRQGRRDKFLTDYKHWRKYILSFYNQENIHILGAYIKETMVGYITVCKMAGSYYIIDPFFDKRAAASSPIQGLIFTLVNQLIEKNGSIRMYYGLDSFNPLPTLNKYKYSMLFRKISATRVYIINPIIKPFLELANFVFVKLLRKKNIRNSLTRKIVNLIQGTRIINKMNLGTD